jgi:hypothetical protein
MLTLITRTPPNCVFEVDDFESDWLYRKPFDYIHARELEGCIPDNDRLYEEAFKHVTPGGWFELQGVYAKFVSDDGTAEKATDANRWMKLLVEGGAKFGKSIDCASLWKEKLEKAGFVDIHEEVLKVSL